MPKRPKFLDRTTRDRSGRQEKSLAAKYSGQAEINSGATFAANDVTFSEGEIEAKTTSKKSYTLKVSDLRVLESKCTPGKMPILVVQFEDYKDGKPKSFAVLEEPFLRELLSNKL